MIFFHYLFFNQYAEISGRGGDSRKAQMNTILLSTVLITLYIVIAFVVYGELHPGYLEKNISTGYVNGKTAGKFLGAIVGVIIFFILKFFIGSKTWYHQTVEQFNAMMPEEQKRVAAKGIRYFVIASLPVIAFIGWALLSLF